MAYEANDNSKAKAGMTGHLLVLPIFVAACCGSGCGKNSSVIAMDYGATNCVTAVLTEPVEERGLRLVMELKDAQLAPARVGEVECHSVTVKAGATGYMAFRVDPAFKNRGLTNVVVTVEYFDDTYGSFGVEYDGFDAQTPDRSEKAELKFAKYHHGEYTAALERIALRRSQRWETATIRLEDVRFENSQEGNADFRFKVSAPRFLVRRVSVCVE